MRRYWVFIMIEAFFVHLFLPEEALCLEDSFYVRLILFNSVILFFTLMYHYGKDRNLFVLLMGGLLLRLIFLFWSEYCSDIFVLPNSGADEFTYYYNAMSNLVKGKEFTGYAQFFSWQASVYGLSKTYGKFINVLFSISAIILLKRILVRLDIHENVQTITLLLACFLPNFAISSALLLRESAIIFLVAAMSYYFIIWWQSQKFKSLVLCIGLSVVAAWLHSGMIAYTIGVLTVYISAERTPEGLTFNLINLRTLALGAMAIAVMLIYILNFDLGITSYFRDADSIQDIVSISDAYEDGGSAYNANLVDNESLSGFLINTPFRILYFLFSPMPWDWRSGTDIIAFIFSGMYYGYTIFSMLLYVARTKERGIGSAMLLISVLILVMFGWGVSNSGTALRHRDKMVIHYLVMFAIVRNNKLEQRLNCRKRREHRNEIQHNYPGL